MFFAFPKLFFRANQIMRKEGKKAKFTRLGFIRWGKHTVEWNNMRLLVTYTFYFLFLAP